MFQEVQDVVLTNHSRGGSPLPELHYGGTGLLIVYTHAACIRQWVPAFTNRPAAQYPLAGT